MIQINGELEKIAYTDDLFLEEAVKTVQLLRDLNTIWKDSDYSSRVEIVKLITSQLSRNQKNIRKMVYLLWQKSSLKSKKFIWSIRRFKKIYLNS